MDLQAVKENLEKRRFKAVVFETAREASEYLNAQIDATSVGMGGSITIKEMGLFDSLASHNEVWWHGKGAQLKEYGSAQIIEKAEDSEVYISSVNGLSAEGTIINIDGRGNRIAATAHGHKRVYLVVGKNKIADSFDAALWRARNIASPKNAQRLGLNTPCAVAGDKCYDCKSPDRICCGFLITEAPMRGQETEIILINENLGY